MEWLYIDRLGFVTYKMIFNQDRSFSHIDEYTYDDEGNELTYKKTSYLNGEWIKTYESIYINNVQKVLYSIKTKADGSLLYRIVYQYDDEGNELSEEVSRYVNNDWEYHYKYEYTYDSNGVKLTETYSVFTNGEWIVQTK